MVCVADSLGKRLNPTQGTKTLYTEPQTRFTLGVGAFALEESVIPGKA